jgi:hypothetical protein
LGLVDPRLLEFDENEATRVIGVALLCTQASPMMRPPMSRVVAMLAGDIEVGAVTSKPSYLTEYNFKDVTSNFLSQEGISSLLYNRVTHGYSLCLGMEDFCFCLCIYRLPFKYLQMETCVYRLQPI